MKKIISIIIVFISFESLIIQQSYGKTHKYYTYLGRIQIDDLNNQVVFNNVSVFNVYEVKDNPARLFLESISKSTKLCLEFNDSGEFPSIKMYSYNNNRFEFEGDYKILTYRIEDKSPWIDQRPPSFLQSMKSYVIYNDYGKNQHTFESDTWWMGSIENRKSIIIRYLTFELERAKTSIDQSFTNSYNDYRPFKEMLQNGQYDILMNTLKLGDLKSAQDQMNKLGYLIDELYYYDMQSKSWIDAVR
ncbi:MAG: hypothetical protein GZ094_21230 [Mariniphaga sp.]|nr:hypothetical protein [Mariniphaga sp.]